MSDETVNGNSATATVTAPAPAASQVSAPQTGTVEKTGGQASAGAQGASSEESFSGLDPTKLSPELQATYKSMQSDYVKKTQAIAEQQKRFAEVEKKAQNYDNLTKDQRFKEYWQGLSRSEKADFKEQKAEAEKRLGERITDEEFGKAFESKDSFLTFLEKISNEVRAKDQKKIESLENKVGLSEAQNVVDSVVTELDPTTKQLIRPDFDSLDEDRLITGYLSVNPAKNPSEYRDKVVEAYNWAKAVSSKYYEKGKSEALKIIQTKAANSSEPPTVTAKGAYSGPDPKKVDVAEAVALARKGIRVPQN